MSKVILKAQEKMGFETNKKLVKDYNNQPERVRIGGKAVDSRSKMERTHARFLQILKEQEFYHRLEKN